VRYHNYPENLSTQEMNAGISRLALATKLAGDGRPKTIAQIISGYKMTRVIDTPMRQIDVLETNSGLVVIRDTQHHGAKVVVSNIHLHYAEAHALAAVLDRLEPDDEEEKEPKR